MCAFFLVSKQADDGPDISLRDGLTRAGWPLPAAQSIAQTTLEYFVVDWDFEYPPEQVSLFDFTGDCPTPAASTPHASFEHADNQELHRRRRRHRSHSFGVGRSGAQHVRHAVASAAASSSSSSSLKLSSSSSLSSSSKAKIPVRFFVTDQRGYASIVAEIARPFNDAQHMMLSSPVPCRSLSLCLLTRLLEFVS